jgi:hypothetical protein
LVDTEKGASAATMYTHKRQKDWGVNELHEKKISVAFFMVAKKRS